MSESRVERLLRRAEECAEVGDFDRSDQLLSVLAPALYLRSLEIRELRRMVKLEASRE